MANHRSAAKRARQNIVRNARNRMRKSRIRTYVRRLEVCLTDGDVDKAGDAFRAAVSELHRGVSRGACKANTASRRISRLSQRLRRLATGSEATAAS